MNELLTKLGSFETKTNITKALSRLIKKTPKEMRDYENEEGNDPQESMDSAITKPAKEIIYGF